MFTKKYVKSYSELDFLVKFWYHVFEEAFSPFFLTLHWGGTMSKKTKTDAKIDLLVLRSCIMIK
jgi:hypothetical protein